jgi:hypothetical protein
VKYSGETNLAFLKQLHPDFMKNAKDAAFINTEKSVLTAPVKRLILIYFLLVHYLLMLHYLSASCQRAKKNNIHKVA